MTAQVLIQVAHVVVPVIVGIALVYLCVLLFREDFEDQLTSLPTTTEGKLKLLLLYFAVPWLFATTGVGIIALPNPSVLEAIPAFPPMPAELARQLGWIPDARTGAAVLAFVGFCLARVHSRASSGEGKGTANSVFLLFVSGLVVLLVMTCFSVGYVALIIEWFFNPDYVVAHSLGALVAFLLTEAVVRRLAPRTV